MIPCTQEGKESRSQCSRSGGGHHSAYSSLYGSQALFQHIISRVIQSGIDVSRNRKIKSSCGIICIFKHIGCCLIDRHCLSTLVCQWLIPCMERIGRLFECCHTLYIYSTMIKFCYKRQLYFFIRN